MAYAIGIHGVDHTRHYHSKPTGGTLFGPKWTSSLEFPRITYSGCVPDPYDPTYTPCQPQTIRWADSSGVNYTYQRIDYGIYGLSASLSSVAAGQFHYDSSNQTVTLFRDKLQYIYDISTGRLLLLKNNEFSAIGFAYDGAGRLSAVTNSAGQSVVINWNGSGSGARVTSIIDTGGNVWQYGYTPGGMLSSVSSPIGDVRTYHYEHGGDSTLLTGISVNGVRFSNYTYYPDKRVQKSSQPGGELVDTFTYGSNTTTVLDARGQTTTYTFTPSQGGLKISNVSRSATSSCPSAVAKTVYDANGWVDYTEDWKGIRTDYTYDAAGRLLSVTTAAGTPRALTVSHQWVNDNIVQTDYKTAAGATYLRGVFGYFVGGWAHDQPQYVKYIDIATGAQRLHTFTYNFDSIGRLLSRVESQSLPSGSANTVYAYDLSGRLTSITNAAGHVTTFSLHDGMGYPGRITDPNGVITNLGFNAQGGLNWQAAYVNGGTRTTSYARDGAGNVTAVSHADGRIDRYQYNNFSRLSAVGNALNDFLQFVYTPSSLDLMTVSARFEPSSSGGVPVGVLGWGFVDYGKVDSLGRVRQDTGITGQQVNFAYDLNSNLTSRTDAQGRTTSYGYDEQNRVVSMTAPDTGTTSYGYNAQGRLATVTDPRGNVTSYTYNAFGEVVTQVSPDSGTTSYTIDAAGRLTGMSKANGVNIAYTYDALGRLTSRYTATQGAYYTYDEGTYGKGRLTKVADLSGVTAWT